ncbi:peptidase S9 [beta proteobacterium AAP51]|nr:peptidase S9 [beta proteobacterium AAP51]
MKSLKKTQARPATSGPGSGKARPLDVDTLWQLQRLGGLSLAPDGRAAVVSAATPSMEKNHTRVRLWLLPTDRQAPRPLTSCGERDGQAAWSPRGDRIAFVARREQEGSKDTAPQLYTIAADGGEAQRHSQFGPGIESFKWLPDGRRVVFSAWVWPGLKGAAAQNKAQQAWSERKESGYVTNQAYYRHWDHNVPMERVLQLWLLDLDSGRLSNLFEGTALELPRDGSGNEVYDISPDGRRLAFVHDPAPEALQSHRLALSEMDLRSRRVQALVDDEAWDLNGPAYSPDGRHLAVTAAHVGLKHTALPQPAVVALGPAARSPAGRGPTSGATRLRVLAPAWDRAVNTPLRWAADSAALLFTAEDRGRCHLWHCPLQAEAPTVLHEGGWVQGFEQAGPTLVVLADSALHPARVLARTGDGPLLRLEHFNDEVLKTVAFGELRETQVTGALGEAVQMWLVFPPGMKPESEKKKHPVTHVIHGGPFAAAGDTFSWRWNPHIFAAAGHVVAQVNYHGSSGFGFQFRDSLIGRQGELELQDIEAATDWLLQQRWADARRIYATGGSYGGFLVAWMNGHVAPGRYRAYVCHAGVFDRVATFSADSYSTRPLDLGAKYWENLARIAAQSPHTFAAQMHTPTLVTHGAQDFRVPDCNGLAYYNTLKARGVDARLLWFPDENHWVLKPRNSRLWYAEFAAWLARHGGPARPARA